MAALEFLDVSPKSPKIWLCRWILESIVANVIGYLIYSPFDLILTATQNTSSFFQTIMVYFILLSSILFPLLLGMVQIRILWNYLSFNNKIACLLANIFSGIIFLWIPHIFQVGEIFKAPSEEIFFLNRFNGALWAGIISSFFYTCLTFQYCFIRHRRVWVLWTILAWLVPSMFLMIVNLEFPNEVKPQSIIYSLIFVLIHSTILGLGCLNCGLRRNDIDLL